MRRTVIMSCILSVFICASAHSADDGVDDQSSPDFDWITYYEDCARIAVHGCGMARIGYEALARANGDAYEAVELLLPAASLGELEAEISVVRIMQWWLQGRLRGESDEPFTWRENFVWEQRVATKRWALARSFAGLYNIRERRSRGELTPGAVYPLELDNLPQQRPGFVECLSDMRVISGNPTEEIRECFVRFAGPDGAVWP